MTETCHFDEMEGIFPSQIPLKEEDLKAKENLDTMLNDDPYAYFDGYKLKPNQSGMDIPLLLHWRKLWKCYDMLDYARYRYKELKTPNHWVPGIFATPEAIEDYDFSDIPAHIPLKDMLTELHAAFYHNSSLDSRQ